MGGTPLGLSIDSPSPRLYDRLVDVLRARHCSPHTEAAYVGRIRRFIEFNDGRHPRELGKDDVNRFLSYLAVERNVAASMQNQALTGCCFTSAYSRSRSDTWTESFARSGPSVCRSS